MKKRQTKSRLLATAMALALMIGILMTPVPAAATGENASVNVFYTLSNDGEFMTGNDAGHTIMAMLPMEIEYFDLAEYGLGEFTHSEFPGQPTLLHLWIKVIEQYYHGDGRKLTNGDLGFDVGGVPGTMGLWDFWEHDMNLMYFVDHAYPQESPGWGATADRIVLEDGMEIDHAMFSDWYFYMSGGFACFDKTNETVSAGDTLNFQTRLTASFPDFETGESITTNTDTMTTKVYDSNWIEVADLTDQSGANDGAFSYTFNTAGLYYVAAFEPKAGTEYADTAPAIATILVEAPVPAVTYPVTLTYAASTGIKIYDASNAVTPAATTTTGAAVQLPSGVYWAEGVDASGSMGRTRFEVTGPYTMTLWARHYRVSNESNSWRLGTDFTMQAIDFMRNEFIPGVTVNTNVMRYTTKNGDSLYHIVTPIGTKTAGFVTLFGNTTITGGNAAGSPTGLTVPTGINVSFTVPDSASLSVNYRTRSYYVYEEQPLLSGPVNNGNGTKSYVYKLASGNSEYNYQVSQPGKVTYCEKFTPNATLAASGVTVTQTQLDAGGRTPKDIDRNPANNSGSNVSDIFLNISEKGYLTMVPGQEHQIFALRNWQAIDGWSGNYFFEPEYRYTVIDANGNPGNSVVTVDAKGKMTARGNGLAIVLVTYDAINANFGKGLDFYSAIWPENTGVFLVSVGETTGGFETGMKAPSWYRAAQRIAGLNLDAEHDVIYYDRTKDGAYYSFTPATGSTVSILRPTVSAAAMTFSGGFVKSGVTEDNGEFTLRLIEGRNIVKITNGASVEYQVITAKKVGVKIVNNTHPGQPAMAGDSITVDFGADLAAVTDPAVKRDVFYHPANKLAGVYNFTMRTAYTTPNGTVINGTSAQYVFASAANAQKLTFTIPAGFEGDVFTLTKGSIGQPSAGLTFGDPVGNHRFFTENGRPPNFTAVQVAADMCILPDISIPVFTQAKFSQAAEDISSILLGKGAETGESDLNNDGDVNIIDFLIAKQGSLGK